MSVVTDLRLEHGFETQQALADETGLAMDTISRLERGAVLVPHTRTLGRLARAFGGMAPSDLANRMAEDVERRRVQA